MKNFMNYWSAYYERYTFLKEISEISKNQEVVDEMERGLASVAVNIWRRVFIIPKKQRDYVFLQEVSVFVQKAFPMFGKRDWNILLRIGVFFSRYPNVFSFITLYIPNNICVFIKNLKKKPFPPCSSYGDMF